MSMDDRHQAFETKYALDQQTAFKVEARASKLIGHWAAELLGMTGDAITAYGKEVVAANLDEPGFDDVKRKLQADFEAADVEVSDHTLESIIHAKVIEARAQIEAEAQK